ncbi:MAG: YetF domain-containing protein [Pseudomonadota bacterium]
MELPWWEFVARAALIYAVLLAMIRVSGKRTVGQFTPFDLLVVMLLSETVSEALSGGDHSVSGGLIGAATLIALNLAVAVTTARSQRLMRIVEGEAVLVGKDGQFYEAVLKRHHISMSDANQTLREADCELKDMRCAILEADGQISILKRSSHEPE